MKKKINFQEASNNFTQWLNALNSATNDSLEEAGNILTGSKKISKDAPSKESEAELVLRQIKKKLDEVIGAYDLILESIGLPPEYKIFKS